MFQTIFDTYHWAEVEQTINTSTEREVQQALQADSMSINQFASLLSPAAEPYLEEMAQKSRTLTLQRFGHNMQLYAPLYLSNECQNICTYCGFSLDVDIPRKTLNEEELRKEAEILSDKGFEHVLLVTGEANKKVGIDYFVWAIKILKSYFSQISIEVQPLNQQEYEILNELGVYAVLVYQETYRKETYKTYHPKGKKSNFNYRLETPDRLGKAGMHKIGIGALLGLENWRVEAFFVALHLLYLKKTYWRSHYSISFPRIKPCAAGMPVSYPLKDKHLVQLLTAFRLLEPDVELSISTRESPELRDKLIPLGVTSMSAESATDPGGYSNPKDALEQFEIDDNRSLKVVKEVLLQKGYEPMLKNWF